MRSEAERKAGLSDIITGLRQLLQDLVAPDLKAIQAKLDAQYNASSAQHNAVMAALEAFRAEMRSEMASLRASLQLELLERLLPSANA
jgi:hypothetical protein